MKKENTYHICHAIIVVAYMVLVGAVVFVSNNFAYLWLLLAVLVYQPWHKLAEIKKPEATESRENS